MPISKRNHFREQVRLQGGLATATDRNAAPIEIITPAGNLSAAAGVPVIAKYDRGLVGTNIVDAAFFTADRAYQVVSISEVHSVAGTNASAVTLQVTKDTGTQAPGAGSALLATAFNLKATANTVQNGTLVATVATLQLAAGNRLAIDVTGTLTDVAGVVVTVKLIPI
jgi:hypothetical protein